MASRLESVLLAIAAIAAASGLAFVKLNASHGRPSPSPPAQRAAPAVSSRYTFHGCPVYTPNDWFTTNLVRGGSKYVSNTVDPNSAEIIANLNSAWPDAHFNFFFAGAQDSVGVNVATRSTPMQRVRYSPGYGPLQNDPWNDFNGSIPFRNGFMQQGIYLGGAPSSCEGDCHVVVMTGPRGDHPPGTKSCVDYETYQSGSVAWDGTGFTTHNGYVHNLNRPFNSQYQNNGGRVTAAGIPFLGTTDVGEDASLPSINHIVALLAPGPSDATRGFHGYVAPATSAEGCGSYCENGLPYGARLRLHSDYRCPSAETNPQADLICRQMKEYGLILRDTLGAGSNYTVQTGVDSSGNRRWNLDDVSALLKPLRITDFDVMTLGKIHY